MYEDGTYLARHPRLHAEDSAWKTCRIMPLVDRFVDLHRRPAVTLLDVGGGAGLVLAAVAARVRGRSGIAPAQWALDVSRSMLDVQRQNNPELTRVWHEDICDCSIADKAVDLVLAIDVLEHIPEADRALAALARIARYAILKVPLERNVYGTVYNAVKGGAPRRRAAQAIGHVHVFSYAALCSRVERWCGRIVLAAFANVFAYYRSDRVAWARLPRVDRYLYAAAGRLHSVSPRLAAALCTDFLLLLVECRPSGEARRGKAGRARSHKTADGSP
jgi:SAM-dependent methyltransferase